MKRFLNFIALPANKRPGIVCLLLALVLGTAARTLLFLSTPAEFVYWDITKWFSGMSDK